DDAYTIIDDFFVLGKIIAANILVDGATAPQFSEFFDEPGQRVLVGGLVTNRDINFNANLWCEAGQGASFSIQICSSNAGGIRRLRLLLWAASLSLRPEARPDTC